MNPPPPKPPKLVPRRRRWRSGLWLLVCVVLLEAAAVVLTSRTPADPSLAGQTPAANPAPPKAGDVIAVDSVQHLTGTQAIALIHHNYPAGVPGEGVPILKVTYHYRSQVPGGKYVSVYGRAYLPDTGAKNLPVFAFAPGTTGIGDQCAASLEQPAKADWGTDDAHLAAYASQGYAGVTTDYEGMRDPGRLHHYMVGEVEGRALLDAVRSLRQLPDAKGRLSDGGVFLGGYSQGGHAAFWGDKIAARYAPDVAVAGVVGFGPVMSVKQTLVDVVRGANINWFGPNVVVSYQDYYNQTYPGVILPARELNLKADVLAHCIDTDLPYWGHTPAGVYTPEFIAAAQTDTVATQYPEFNQALELNTVGAVSTTSAKRINQGGRDNVVLPTQAVQAMPALCASSLGPAALVPYPDSTHYTTMLHSFGDTVAWMKAVAAGQLPASTCTPAG